jgi:TolB protein
MKSKIILTVLGLLSLFYLLYPQQEVVLSIKEGMPAIPIAIPPFIVHNNSPQISEASQELYQILSDDIKYSRVFQILPKSYYDYIRPLNPDKIFFKDWESVQAKILFVGEVHSAEGDSILFEGKVYDVRGERFIIGRRYKSERNLLPLVAHKMADAILHEIFGEKTIFTSKIVFISNRDGNDEIYMMDYDGRNQTRLTFNTTLDYMPAWASDGKNIAFTSYRKNKANLLILNPFEGKITEVASKGTNFGPSFSPDGKKLAFCSQADEGNTEIFVADSDGKNARRLTFNNAIDTAPSWSPTSREIAFTSDRGGTPQIYIMDAEGSNVRRISFGGNHQDGPAWSPTGDRVAYVSRVDQIFDIYVLNLRTNQIMKLTESNARNESPSWSADGRHIVFSSNLTGTIQVYTIDYDGANLRRLTSKGENKLPDWSR